jgi:sterol desaturase/sphingolipid hydroxylase (fatty acid hydroxylase superfamily)
MPTRLAYPGLLALFGAFAGLASQAGPAGFVVAGTAINVILVLLERRFPLVGGEEVIGDPELGHDIGHTLLANGISQVSDATVLAAGALVAGRLGEAWGLHLWPTGWPFAVQVIVLVTLADGIEYWRHRLEHHVAWLWRIHALHHDVVRLHVVKSARNSVADMVLRSIIVYGPLAAIGVPAAVLVWHPLVLLVLGPIAHANLALPIPAFAHRMIVTPPGHRAHHAKDRRLSDGNFAVVTPLWDLLFGTFHDPTGHPPPAVGVDDRLPASFVRQALSPLWWPGRRPDASSSGASTAAAPTSSAGASQGARQGVQAPSALTPAPASNAAQRSA